MNKIDPQPKLACVKSGFYLASYMDLSVMLQQRCQGDIDALVLRVHRKVRELSVSANFFDYRRPR